MKPHYDSGLRNSTYFLAPVPVLVALITLTSLNQGRLVVDHGVGDHESYEHRHEENEKLHDVGENLGRLDAKWVCSLVGALKRSGIEVGDG